MVISMLDKCRERARKTEETYYNMLNYSNDIKALEKLSEEMIDTQLMVIRMEKQMFELSIHEEYDNHFTQIN